MSIMKTFAIALILLLTATIVTAQNIIWRDEITGTNISSATPFGASGPVNTTDRFVADGITVSGINRGPGVNSSTANHGYQATSWSTNVSGEGGISTPVFNPDDYFEFVLTPGASYYINFGSFIFTGDPSGSGPRYFALWSSVDDFASHTEHGTFTRPDDNVFTQNMPLTAIGSSVTVPIKFRLYGWGATATSGNFEIQRFEFTGTSTLPVNFGQLQAMHHNGAIHVTWSTYTEINNSHFEIQASTGTSEFKTIQTIASKNGNSDISQSYTASLDPAGIASLFGWPLILGLLSLGFCRRYKIAGCIFCGLMAVTIIACNKQAPTDSIEKEKIFIRIKQVDIDGKHQYSKTVQVIHQ